MTKRDIPTYAIVELLMRLTDHNKSIGDYKNHNSYAGGIRVKTSGGSIIFSEDAVMQQFNDPKAISDDMLIEMASLFKASN